MSNIEPMVPAALAQRLVDALQYKRGRGDIEPAHIGQLVNEAQWAINEATLNAVKAPTLQDVANHIGTEDQQR